MRNIITLALVTVITSAILVSFLKLCQVAVDTFRLWAGDVWWLPLIWTPLLTIAIVHITNKYSPGTAGSGNQQIKAALDDRCDEETRSSLVSLRVATFKYFSTVLGFLAGLSIGREGPTVQIASSLMYSVRKFTTVTPKFLIAVGGAIGLAVAFKAVIAGTVFALEEFSEHMKRRSSVLFFAMISISILTCYALEGNDPFYTSLTMPSVTISIMVPLVLTVIMGSALGGLFARTLLSVPTKIRAKRPLVFAGVLGLVIAIVGILCGGMTYSDGYNYTKGVIEGDVGSYLFVPLKFIATMLTAWTGVPAGMFSPLLSIGAGVGNTIADMFSVNASLLLLCGMSSFLSGVIRAPLTSGFLAVEVLGAYSMIPLSLLVALFSDWISDRISPPLWLTQRDILLFNTKKETK